MPPELETVPFPTEAETNLERPAPGEVHTMARAFATAPAPAPAEAPAEGITAVAQHGREVADGEGREYDAYGAAPAVP